ncbi:MazG-like family protein (plasmid) [Nicoliella spurrieriana]|uniref:MazG-like family protein n=1 Tax=Nicoliella spurrieriana TaxID=2925830 RepID=A0A976RR18_9LACO|nr:MazG-like family protein [Nicoliella spurrieriana]UQS86228.1 MazG-like family protein [Nicoliella spurrieriana]
MDLNEHTKWLVDFYKKRKWYDLSPEIRMNFLIEEVGELARAIRAEEIGRDHPGEAPQSKSQKDDNLHEELADVFDQLLIICSKYGINPASLMDDSENKLHRRWNE